MKPGANALAQPAANNGEMVTGQVHVHDVNADPSTANAHVQRVARTMEPAGAVAVTAYLQAYMN